MGLVICETHGEQQGPLCCEHVLDGSYGRVSSAKPAADPGAVAFLQIDLFDDRSEMLGIVLCRECVVRFGRVNDEILGSQYFGDEVALPWICPICNPCLESWTGHRTPGWVR